MKVLAISDSVDPLLYEHFDVARWRDVELVISCGDLPPNYLDFLATTLCCPVLYVRGNHDQHYSADSYAGCYNLHGRRWTGGGITVVGFEGSPRYNGSCVQYSEDEMRRRVRRTTRGMDKIDVVVTHAPPLGCHDLPDPAHRGFECFADLIHRRHPRFLIHGHTHMYGTAQRVSQFDTTATVNAFGHYLITL